MEALEALGGRGTSAEVRGKVVAAGAEVTQLTVTRALSRLSRLDPAPVERMPGRGPGTGSPRLWRLAEVPGPPGEEAG